MSEYYPKLDWKYDDDVTEHDLNRIEGELYRHHQQLSHAEKKSILLREGVQAVNVLSDSGLQVAFEGRTVVNYVPPFTSREWTIHANATVNSPTKITLQATAQYQVTSCSLVVKSGETYTISVDTNSTYYVKSLTDSSSILAGVSGTHTFTVPNNTTGIKIELSNTQPTGTFTFEDVSLVEGTEAMPYVRGVQHTRNPYVISQGKNIFDGALEVGGISASTGATNTDTTYVRSKGYIKVLPSTDYVVKNHSEQGDLTVFYYDKNYNFLGFKHSENHYVNSFTTPQSTEYLKIRTNYIENLQQNIQLELGSTATDFTEHSETYLFGKDVVFAEGEKAYQNANGEWRKWQEWEQIELTGNLTYRDNSNKGIDFKVAQIELSYLPELWQNNSHLVKFDGKLLARASRVHDGIDLYNNTAPYLNISIPNRDSGWGTDYNPTPEEIKAYFLGWKMYNAEGTNGRYSLYNGTGTMAWVKITRLNDTATLGASDHTTTLPAQPAGTDSLGNTFTPYQLHYKLAEPHEVPVEFEGSLLVHEGLNQIEVGTGVVVRERANPVFNKADKYFINRNASNFETSRLKNKVGEFIGVYKDNKLDLSWTFQSESRAYGKEWAETLKENFDPTASYSVTYLVLDKYLFTAGLGAISAVHNRNLATRVEENEKTLIEQVRKVSVLENELFPLLEGEVVDHNLHVENPPLGHYVRYANGLQICTAYAFKDNWYTVPDEAIDVIFPSTFIATPIVQVSARSSSPTNRSVASVRSTAAGDLTPSKAVCLVTEITSTEFKTSSATMYVYVTAIGRWK